jgi:hypothetical protein
MTTSTVAIARDCNVVFAMKCVLNERSLFSPAATTLCQGSAGHVDGS